MEAKRYEDQSPDEVINRLEAENCGVDEHYEFLKPYEEKELEDLEREFLDLTKELVHLENRKNELLAPIVDELKILKKQTSSIGKNLAAGGRRVTEKVYCFPDYEQNLMGLYDNAGNLVAVRPLSRSERQLHINSNRHMNKTSNL